MSNQTHNIVPGLAALAVEITKLKDDPKNARVHPGRNIEGIKESLVKFGQRKPVVVNDLSGIILAGNGLVRAARELGWSHVAVVFVSDDPATATGYALADNRTQETSFFDQEVLQDLLRDLESIDPDLIVGWSPSELDEIMGRLMQEPLGGASTGEGDQEDGDEGEGGGAGLGGGKSDPNTKTLTVVIPTENYEAFIGDVETVARGLGLDDSSEAIIRGMSILAIKGATP